MRRTPAAAALDEVIRTGLAPPLKADGYRKDGRTFRRERERCIHVVNLQSSRSSTADEVRFTMNVGVYFRQVHALLAGCGGPGRRGPTEADCTIRARIGPLSPARSDTWWTATRGSTPEALRALADELREAYERHARPWLDRVSDLRDTLDEVERIGDLRTAAAIQLVLGDVAAARSNAERLVREKPGAILDASWARQLGLIP